MARDPGKQAHWAAVQMQAHGESRADTRNDLARQSSIGTSNTYETALRQLAEHLREERAGDLRSVTVDQAREWLNQRAEQVSQATLDRDRQAVQAWLSHRQGERVELPRAEHQSQVQGRGLAEQSRVYTPDQMDRVQERMAEHNALAVQVAREAGIRAQEAATIARPEDRPATGGRDWREDRGAGRTETVTYTVQGKGGLVREVQVSHETADRLEAMRRDQPVTVTDRGTHLTSYYQLGYGQSLSQAFSAASQRELGWSVGLHGVRHVYAQERLEQVQRHGYSYDQARTIVAQEVGHFRSETTEAYLR